MVWSFKDLKEDVAPLWGVEQASDLELSCTSLSDRWFYVWFHFQEATKEIGKLVPESMPAEDALFALLGGLDDDQRSFQQLRRIAAAHAVACLQSFHAIGDTLAYIVCLGMGLNLASAKSIDLRAVTLTNVRKRLSGNAISDLLGQLVEHDEHRYLSAVVNHSKHRSIVKTAYHVDLTGTQSQPHGLQLVAFNRDGTSHPARLLKPFLKAEYDRQQTLMQEIGAELNKQVRDLRLAKITAP